MCQMLKLGVTVFFIVASSGTVQVFNIEMRSRLKSFEMTQKVIFWKWISQNILALVTESSVFHWTIDGTCSTIVYWY